MRQIECTTDRQTLRELAKESGDKGGVIFVPVKDPPSAGETVRVLIHFEGFAQDFAFLGTCTSSRQKGRGKSLPAGATIEVSLEHMAGLRKALSFARGEDVKWQMREHPRHSAGLDSRMEGPQGEVGVEVLDLSMGGARIAMEGEMPSMGEEVSLVVEPGRGIFPLKLRGQVMWLSFFSDSRSLGIKFVGGGFGWKRKLLALVERIEAAEGSATGGTA